MTNIYQKLKTHYKISFYSRFYFWVRWKICPFLKMESLIPKEGKILDLGCGEGVFTNLLALTSTKRKVFGVDLAQRRIHTACEVSQGISNVSFIIGDATEIKIDGCAAIVVSDLLHHLDLKSQEKLLRTAYTKLKHKGYLLIKEINKDYSVRYYQSWLADHVLYPKDHIYYRSRDDLIEQLEGIGFKVKVLPHDAKFLSTFLYLCEKFP